MKRKNTRNKVPVKKAAVQQKRVSPVPAGYHSVTPYLSIRGAALDPLCQCLARDEFHHQEIAVAHLFQSVNARDIGMIQ